MADFGPEISIFRLQIIYLLERVGCVKCCFFSALHKCLGVSELKYRLDISKQSIRRKREQRHHFGSHDERHR